VALCRVYFIFFGRVLPPSPDLQLTLSCATEGGAACMGLEMCHLRTPATPSPCHSPTHQVASCCSTCPQALNFAPRLQLAKLVTQLRGDYLSS
jgi:hypothetical protein